MIFLPAELSPLFPFQIHLPVEVDRVLAAGVVFKAERDDEAIAVGDLPPLIPAEDMVELNRRSSALDTMF